METTRDFLLYIRNINYEKEEDSNGLVLYIGYLAILSLFNKISTSDEQYFIYDKIMFNIYNKLKNNEKNSLNETAEESSGFIKIKFYENDNINCKISNP